ncbi:MAG: NADPH-dependent 7-cyano-7-deazaguanine reductase QueF, partial [Sulfuricurvum sp.]|nr:NADPH-dependent 7-cyano-7-deazaguanine reductase QueF [Sulfuricurvum sp.]
ENSANEIYSVFEQKIAPKRLKVIADYYPRGNVHTVIEIDSEKIEKVK